MNLRFGIALMWALSLPACSSDDTDDSRSDAAISGDALSPDSLVGLDSAPASDGPQTSSLPYRFVRIDDLSTTETPDRSGSDIDALILVKAEGQRIYATSLEDYAYGGAGTSTHLDPSDALNAPDAYTDYPDDPSQCSADQGFVSLGGPGGRLVVGFAEDIEQGDVLEVLELGDCGTTIAESYTVSVGVAAAATEDFVSLGNATGRGSFNIPELPSASE